MEFVFLKSGFVAQFYAHQDIFVKMENVFNNLILARLLIVYQVIHAKKDLVQNILQVVKLKDLFALHQDLIKQLAQLVTILLLQHQTIVV